MVTATELAAAADAEADELTLVVTAVGGLTSCTTIVAGALLVGATLAAAIFVGGQVVVVGVGVVAAAAA